MRASPQSESPPERTVFPVPDHEETLFAITTDPEATYNSVSIYYKMDVRPQGTVSTYRRSLIEALYHRMLNQRLHELTKLPKPPFLGAYSGQGRWLRSKEFFILGAGVQNNGFDAGLEALLIEAARVREHGFTASELAREKKEMLRSIEQSYRERDKQRSSGFASEYVRHLLTDEAIPGIAKEYELYQELVPGIALEEVNALASEWTSEKNRVITVEAPEQEGIAVPSEQDLLAIFAQAAQQEIAPYADEVSDEPLVAQVPAPADIVERSEIPEIGATWWTLANGIRVCLKPTDFKNDEILFRAYSPGGHSLVPDADYVAASTATSVVSEGGVGPFNKIELEKKLAGKVVRVSPWISSLREGVSGSASPEDIQTMFELIYAFFTAPRQDSTAFQAYQTLMRGSIQNRSARPETAFSDTIAVTMAQYHHRARPWSLELLDEMDLATSMAVYQDRFADASDFSFFFVGNFTLEGIEPLVRTYLGGLPTTGREETWRDVGIEAPEGVIDKAVYRGIEPKSRSQMIFTGPFEYDGWKNNLELRAMTSVLEIKLREVLREDLGGTYGVWVSSSGSHYPDEKYRISISFGSDPDRVEELTQVIFEQIDSLKTVGTTDLYVDKVKEMRKRQRETSPQGERLLGRVAGIARFQRGRSAAAGSVSSVGRFANGGCGAAVGAEVFQHGPLCAGGALSGGGGRGGRRVALRSIVRRRRPKPFWLSRRRLQHFYNAVNSNFALSSRISFERDDTYSGLVPSVVFLPGVAQNLRDTSHQCTVHSIGSEDPILSQA